MKSVFASALLALSLLATPVAAQSESTTPQNIEPAGIVRQDWEIGADAIKAVPSPIGNALPGTVVVDVGSRGAEAHLYLDGKFQQYAYDCADGRCLGFAPDLWQLVPPESRRTYVDGLLDALMNSYPNLGIYRVFMDGQGWAAWDQAHGRSYFFQPPI